MFQQVRKGEIVEIKTLVAHPMETGLPHRSGWSPRAARHHPSLPVHSRWTGDLQRRAVSGDLREPLLVVHDPGAEQRRSDLPLVRRQGRRSGRDGQPRGRMRMHGGRRNPALRVVAILFAAGMGGAAAQMDGQADSRRSGFADMSRDSQAMQSDDNANPGMLWVGEGKALWSTRPSEGAKSCADCHGPAESSMKGVSARYPAFDQETQSAMDLQGRIVACMSKRQGAPESRESREVVALSTYVGHQSRGMPLSPPADDRLGPLREAGRELFTRRQGQLDLSCANCHDANAGKRLAGNVIPQGHPNGYPLYRLAWQSVGSLQRRMRNCMTGVRAEPYAVGSTEFLAIELFLAERAKGMLIETPAVRP